MQLYPFFFQTETIPILGLEHLLIQSTSANTSTSQKIINWKALKEGELDLKKKTTTKKNILNMTPKLKFQVNN